MMSERRATVLLIAALMTITAVAPMAGASTIRTVIDTSTGSANLTAYNNATATISSSDTSIINFLSDTLNGSSGSYAKVFNPDDSTFIAVQSAISAISSEANLTYLNVEASRTILLENPHEISISHALKVVINVTDIYQAGSYDLGWRSFTDNGSIVINSTNYNHIVVDGQVLGYYSSLNFSAFASPLTEWNRTYYAAENETVFSMDAGYTLNYTGNITLSTGYYNVTLRSDPSYSIVTPGYAIAGSDTVTISNAPAAVPPYTYYLIAVIVIAAGLVMSVLLMRRRA